MISIFFHSCRNSQNKILKFPSCGHDCTFFGLVLSFLYNRQLRVVLDIYLMMVFLKVSFFALNFSYCALMIFMMMLSVLMILLFSLCVIRQAFDLWLKLEYVSVLEFDLRYIGLGQEVAC